MAKFDKLAVLAKIKAAPMVPVFYHKDVEVAKKVIKACYDGGEKKPELQLLPLQFRYFPELFRLSGLP